MKWRVTVKIIAGVEDPDEVEENIVIDNEVLYKLNNMEINKTKKQMLEQNPH